MRVQVKLDCKKAAAERHRRENVKASLTTTGAAAASAATASGDAAGTAAAAAITSSSSTQRPASAGVSRTEVPATTATAAGTAAGVGSSRAPQRRPSTADAYNRRATVTATSTSNDCAVQQLQQQLQKFSQLNSSSSSKQRASMIVNGKPQAVHCTSSSGATATATANATAAAGAAGAGTTSRFTDIRDADDAGIAAMLKVLPLTKFHCLHDVAVMCVECITFLYYKLVLSEPSELRLHCTASSARINVYLSSTFSVHVSCVVEMLKECFSDCALSCNHVLHISGVTHDTLNELLKCNACAGGSARSGSVRQACNNH
jgi:hypothetical protein